MTPLTLDHVGVVGADLARLRSSFARLGFSPTTPQPLMRRDPSTGRLDTLDQQSCHAVLKRGYIELSSVSSTDASHHLSRYASPATAVRILAIGTDDIEGTRAACERRGLRTSPPAWAAREIAYGPQRGEARFHWFMIDARDSPDGLVCFVHNHTPALIYQPEVTDHENGARALVEVAIVSANPAAAGQLYARALGIQPAGDDSELTFVLGHGMLRVHDGRAHRLRYGEHTGVTPDGFGLIGVEVADLDAAQALLVRRGVRCERRDRAIVVPNADGRGAALVLHAPAAP